MPRKKEIKTGVHLKFIPQGRIADLEKLAVDFKHIDNSLIAFAKFVEVFSNILERCKYSKQEYVKVSQRITGEQIGLTPSKTGDLINMLVESGFLKLDRTGFVAGKQSYKYKPVFEKLDMLIFFRNNLNNKVDEMLQVSNEGKITNDEKVYLEVLKKVKLDKGVYEYMNNVYRELCNKVTSNKEYNIGSTVCGISVPAKESGDSISGISVPELPVIPNDISGISVPYMVLGTIPVELLPAYKLLAEKYRISRPNTESRVYTNITNLGRGYRKYLRINGKPLIGFDIANSQPLIASVAFIRFSQLNYGKVNADVQDYKEACENGLFYEYFMELNSIDTTCDDARTAFKKEFFGKVFYTKEVEKDNYLKTQFKEKYPTCYEALFSMKGGLYSEDYWKVPVMMSEIETAAVFSANMKLIKEGYSVVNIFDAIYTDSVEARDKAKQMVSEFFGEMGIYPKLKDIDYREDTEDILVEPLGLQIQDETENEYECQEDDMSLFLKRITISINPLKIVA